MAEPKTLDPVVVTDSTPDAAPSPVAKQPSTMPNFQQMLMNRLNRPLIGGGGNPQQALQQTIAGEQAKSDVAMKMAREKEQTMRPLQEAKVERIGQTEQQQAGISKELNTPFQVPQETVADFSALGGLVGIMGVMLGTSGKMSAQNVLSSATGILDGYKKGRADLIAQKQKEFEANMKRLTALSSQVQAELKTYMEKAAVKDQTAALSLEKVAAEANNGIVAAVVTGQSAFKIQEMNQQLANASRAAQTHYDTVLMQLAKDQQAREDAAAKPPTIMQDQDGNPIQWNGKTRSWVAADMPEGVTSITRIGTPPKAAKTQGTVGYAAALQSLLPNETVTLKENEAKPILEAIQATARLTKFIDKAQDPDIDFGEIGRISNRIESLITRNLGDRTEITNANQLAGATSTAVDQAIKELGLSPNDKNIVFYKEAIFNILDAERAIRGGSILPVGIVNMLTPLQDPKNMNRAQFTNIMLGNLDRVAAKTGLEQNVLKDAISKIKPFEYTPSYTPPASTGAAPSASTTPKYTTPEQIADATTRAQAALAKATTEDQKQKIRKIYKEVTGRDL